jgi:hypothetical protein
MSAGAPESRRDSERAVADSSPDDGLFHAPVSLDRVAGVEIGLSWSWLLILGLIVWSLAATVFPSRVPDSPTPRIWRWEPARRRCSSSA